MPSMIIGVLKHGAEAELVNYRSDFNEHVGASGSAIRLLALLRDEHGKRVGYMALYDGGISDATRWLRQSPYYQANLYERADVYECDVEIEQPSPL